MRCDVIRYRFNPDSGSFQTQIHFRVQIPLQGSLALYPTGESSRSEGLMKGSDGRHTVIWSLSSISNLLGRSLFQFFAEMLITKSKTIHLHILNKSNHISCNIRVILKISALALFRPFLSPFPSEIAAPLDA